MALLKGRRSSSEALASISVLIHEGRVVISDYSHSDDYHAVLALLGAAGVKPAVETASWCG